MAVSVTSIQSFAWAGGYPLAASGSFDASGATTLLVAMTTPAGYTWPASAVFAGVPMTAIGQSPSASGGDATIWVWQLRNPPAGLQTVSVSRAAEYCAPGVLVCIALAGTATAAPDAFDVNNANTPLNLTITTTGTGELVLVIGQACHVTPGAGELAAAPGFTVLYRDTTSELTNRVGVFSKTAPTPGAYPATLTTPYNQIGAMLLAYAADSVSSLLGIASTETFGLPTAVYSQTASPIGIDSTLTLGEPSAPLATALSVLGIPATSAVGIPSWLIIINPEGIPSEGALGLPSVVRGGFPVTLNPGQTLAAVLRFQPTAAGVRPGSWIITGAEAGRTVPLSATGTSTGLPVISMGNAVIETATVGPVASLSTDTLTFPTTAPGALSAPVNVTVSNIGSSAMTVGTIGITGPFSQTNDSTGTINPGGSITIAVKYAPIVAGPSSGTLTIPTNGPGPVSTSLTGTAGAITLSRLSAMGNQIVDGANEPVRLVSVNWFGAESPTFIPHGLWARRWTDMLDAIAAHGFNCIRLPFSDSILSSANVPNGLDIYLNADLVGLTALQILDKIIEYGAGIGLRFVLDHHRTSAGAGTDGWPPAIGEGGYPFATWQAMWSTMATRYAATPAVCGYDCHNEPHNIGWYSWAARVEALDAVIRPIAPDWLCIVEGVGEFDGISYWWGGQLAGAADRPVVLSVPNKLVYSPHTYGISVSSQDWLKSDSNMGVANWPLNTYAVHRAAWGYLFENGTAPIWIGEFGGHFGRAGNGTVSTSITPTNAQYEREWLAELIKYLNGDFDGDGDITLMAGAQLGMSFAYWAWNCNSVDTGGLLCDDWTTLQTVKLALLADLGVH